MSQCHLNDCCFLEEQDWFVFLNAYWCNLSICMLFQNAEWVQIAVMKLFHYGDEQCWINRNNEAECFIEPSVKVFWHQVLLCLQLCWLAWGGRWLLEKWNSSNTKLERLTQKQANNRFHLQMLFSTWLKVHQRLLQNYTLALIRIFTLRFVRFTTIKAPNSSANTIIKVRHH